MSPMLTLAKVFGMLPLHYVKDHSDRSLIGARQFAKELGVIRTVSTTKTVVVRLTVPTAI